MAPVVFSGVLMMIAMPTVQVTMIPSGLVGMRYHHGVPAPLGASLSTCRIA